MWLRTRNALLTHSHLMFVSPFGHHALRGAVWLGPHRSPRLKSAIASSPCPRPSPRLARNPASDVSVDLEAGAADLMPVAAA